MKILVTGGAGFIGSNLTDELLKQGHNVTVMDNFSTGKQENLSNAFTYENFDVIHEDIRDLDSCYVATKDKDFVFHLAALGSVPRSVNDPLTSHNVNSTGTLNVLMASNVNKVKRVICSGSSSVYGDTPTLPKIESQKENPRSPYAITKLTTELYARIFYDVYDLETITLRYFNVFGPRQDPFSEYAAVIPRFAKKLLDSDQPVIYGDGMQSRDFTYVKNVVHANILSMKAPIEACGKGYNIACGSRISLNSLLSSLNKFLGTSLKAIYEPPRTGDVKHSLADITLAKEFLGYQPLYQFHDGLKECIEWYKKFLKD